MATKEQKAEYQKRYKAKPGVKEKYRQLNRDWIEKNRPRYNRAKSMYRLKLKMSIFSLYCEGRPKCAQCGFDNDVDALCMDHINNDGAEHRKSLGVSNRGNSSGTTIYERIKAKGFMPELQILCYNCNAIKELRRKRNGVPSQDALESIDRGFSWR